MGRLNFDRRRDGWIETFDWLQDNKLIPPAPRRLLELGCGNGMVTLEAARRGYRVDGIDISGEAIAWAQERSASTGLVTSFHRGDVRAMPIFAASLFDIVIDGNCLHCIFGDDRRKCLEEVRRILRPEGVFVVSTMCGDPKSDDARAKFDCDARALLDHGRPYRTLKPGSEIEAEVANAGFRVVNHRIKANPWWDHLTLVVMPP